MLNLMSRLVWEHPILFFIIVFLLTAVIHTFIIYNFNKLNIKNKALKAFLSVIIIYIGVLPCFEIFHSILINQKLQFPPPFYGYYYSTPHSNTNKFLFWRWDTTSPMTVLPFLLILTVLIETLAVRRYNKIASKKIFTVTAIANIILFIAPYVVRTFMLMPEFGVDAVFAAFFEGSYYIVSYGYLLLLILKIPAIFLLLKKYIEDKKRLIIVILTTSIITTVIVAFIERVLCVGSTFDLLMP